MTGQLTPEDGEARGQYLRECFTDGIAVVRERFARDYFAALAYLDGVRAAVDDLRPGASG